MKPVRKLQATTLKLEELHAASGGRGTLCGNMMHCSGCGASWGADAQGSFGTACPSCGLGINTDPSGGTSGGGGGGGGGCGPRVCCV